MNSLIPILIYVVTPILGVILFFITLKRLKSISDSSVDNYSILFVFKLLAIFFCHGIMLVLTLTSIFWKHSGISYLGTLFLIVIAPFLMAIIAAGSNQKRKTDEVENIIFKMAISFYVVLPIVIMIGLALE